MSKVVEIPVKAFLVRDGRNPETRRFHLRHETFQHLEEKLRSVFPQLVQYCFNVTWIDREGDDIIMSSDEELADALTETINVINQDLLKVIVRPTNKTTGLHNECFHQGVTCNSCNRDIYGYRYRCVQCDEYDLCETCDQTETHPKHSMLKLAQPVTWGPAWKRIQREILVLLSEDTKQTNPKGKGRRWKRRQKTFPYDRDTETTKHENQTTTTRHSKLPEENGSYKENLYNCNSLKKVLGQYKHSGKIPTNDADATKDDDDFSSIEVIAEEVDDALFPSIPVKLTTSDTTTGYVMVHQSRNNAMNATSSSESDGTAIANSYGALGAKPKLSFQQTYLHQDCNNNDTEPRASQQDPKIKHAVKEMVKMGFSNEDGWLNDLLVVNNGSITQALDILLPANKSDK